jgi:hypothetical protein
VWYLAENFGSYTDSKEGRALSYELEYIVAGKDNDGDNLEAVVERVLALRQLENMITIATSESMMAQAYALATALAGVTVNPLIIQAVQTAVVAIWALVESILDVRTLLQGGKVALVKTAGEWTSNVMHLGQFLTGGVKAKESENGIRYMNYLAVFLYLLDNKTLGLHPLDLIEVSLQQQADGLNCQMDALVYAVTAEMEYDGSPIFFSYMGTGTPSLQFYHYSKAYTMTY